MVLSTTCTLPSFQTPSYNEFSALGYLMKVSVTFKDNWFTFKELLKRVIKLKTIVEFLDKLVLEGRRKTDMLGPGLDIGAYIFSLQLFNNMTGFISLPHLIGGETNS